MIVDEALQRLGTSRVVWIDDEFNRRTDDLARMLVKHIEITQACRFPELSEVISNFGSFQDTAEEDIRNILDEDPAAAARIQDRFLTKLAEQESAQKDLSRGAIDRVCRFLKIEEADRLPFDKAGSVLAELCKDGLDNGVLYIVDLNDAVTNDENRGLDVLVALGDMKSRGTAFLLTRETDTANEANKEADLRTKLEERVGGAKVLEIPTCVIAKERLFDQDDDDAIAGALQIAIKRAGLRRSVHEALWKAEAKLLESFFSAADSLTRIVPEKLEAFVVEKSFKEGLSELHVVERALTAHIARDIRNLFGTDISLIESAKRMRALRAIELEAADLTPDENLENFRKAEVWEEPDLINTSLSPVACGDVFETLVPSDGGADTGVRFILLGQPCDVALRSNGKRDQDTALFVPLKRAAASADEGTLKKPMLPFKLDRVQYACDFRNATNVRIDILDLASFRKDGLLRVDSDHKMDPNLLPGLTRAYKDRTKLPEALMKVAPGKNAAAQAAEISTKLQLTFDTDRIYKAVARGVLHNASPSGTGGQVPIELKYVTWGLRRCGRIRMPYAAALLESYMNVMTRRAFDIDYTDLRTPGPSQKAPVISSG